ncbi:MAG: Ig-like domain-containing protein [Oscillospiraceae bacterium]|nr:Ig-like domain-containing protein [Oscillospiraceae bacterium]
MQANAPENAALNHSGITLVIGEQCQVQISGVEGTPVWSTSDPTVATVSADGTVIAVGVGAAIVTCTEGDNTADCIVRCISSYPY